MPPCSTYVSKKIKEFFTFSNHTTRIPMRKTGGTVYDSADAGNLEQPDRWPVAEEVAFYFIVPFGLSYWVKIGARYAE